MNSLGPTSSAAASFITVLHDGSSPANSKRATVAVDNSALRANASCDKPLGSQGFQAVSEWHDGYHLPFPPFPLILGVSV